MYVHTMLIKTPLLHQSLGPPVVLSLSLCLFLADSLECESGCVTQGILASFLLPLSHHQLRTTRLWSNKGPTDNQLKIQHSKNEDHGIQSHHFMANRCGNNGNSDRLFSRAPKSLQMVTAVMKLKHTCSLEEKL